jgi:hypothetical protein
MKFPRAAYNSVKTKDELGHDLWGEDLYREREKWQRWVLDAKIVTTDQAITLPGKAFGFMRNKILFIMLTIRS